MAEPSVSTSSLLFHALLPSFQRRIPELRSLKRTFTQCEAETTCYSRALSSGSITPPPSYQSQAEELDSSDERPFIHHTRSLHSITPRRPSSSGSAMQRRDSLESKSGVQWRYADPGFALLSLASQEASEPSLSPNLIRRQYIDGVACMLRGLPSSLTADEDLSIREALPVTLKLEVATREGQLLNRPGFGRRHSAMTGDLERQSALHRGVAVVTLHAFLAVAFALPYLQMFIGMVYQYDMKHKISERMLARGVSIVDVVGKKTLTLALQLCALNEGKVGDVLKETGVYLVQGLSGGLYDGLGEALKRRDGELGKGG